MASVRDTGIDIPASALSTVFDMFRQVDWSIERTSGGLGIGLALIRELIEMHGGTVSAASVEGEESTFTVYLPVSEPATLAQAILAPDPPRSALRRVLAADDNRNGAESTHPCFVYWGMK